MGGRRFGARNAAPPECVVKLAEQVPACFEPRVWRLYLDTAYSAVLNEPAERMAMQRGQPPDYCSECTVGYRERMRRAGRCHPPTDAHAQLTLQEDVAP